MKTVISILAIGMFLFAGCAKNDVFVEGLDGFELNVAPSRANVPMPFKVDGYASRITNPHFYFYRFRVLTLKIPTAIVQAG